MFKYFLNDFLNGFAHISKAGIFKENSSELYIYMTILGCHIPKTSDLNLADFHSFPKQVPHKNNTRRTTIEGHLYNSTLFDA